MNNYYLGYYNFHSSDKPSFEFSYDQSKDKYYIKNEYPTLNLINQTGYYSKYEILDFYKKNYNHNFTSNSTWRRYILDIHKEISPNDNLSIFTMDTELNGGCNYYIKEEGEEQFKDDVCKCINFCLDLLKETQINQSIQHHNHIIKRCNISGAQTNLSISLTNDNETSYYIIENDIQEPLMFIKNNELLKNIIKYQMRYARYFESINILTSKEDYKDYYHVNGHDSTQLLDDCYNYLVSNLSYPATIPS